MKVEDRLSPALADVDEDAVVLETRLLGCLGHEFEHPLRFVPRELTDVAKRGDVTLRQDEQVRVGAGVDVPDRDEAVALRDVIAFVDEPAEEAVVRQRRSPRR